MGKDICDVVVPVYNEGSNIKNLLDRIVQQVNIPVRIIVVYDFEEDNTLPVLNEISSNYSFEIMLKKNDYGRGALNAIKTGLYSASNEAVVVVMADLSDSLQIIENMYTLISHKGYDLVCGSRYMKGGKQHGGPFLKGLFSRLAGLSLNLLTGIPTHDISNSFKMYRTSMIKEMEIESSGGFEIGMEITVKAFISGKKITEVPSEWFDRTDGESNFKMWTWMPNYLHWYFLCIKKTWFSKGKNK